MQEWSEKRILFQSPSAWECDEDIIKKTFDRNLEILLENNLIDENNKTYHPNFGSFWKNETDINFWSTFW